MPIFLNFRALKKVLYLMSTGTIVLSLTVSTRFEIRCSRKDHPSYHATVIIGQA